MSSARQSQFKVTAAWLLAWLAAGILVTAEIHHNHIDKVLDLRVRAAKQSALRKEENANALNALEQDLKRKSRDAVARRNVELDKAWGGPITAAFKNPAFSIRDALQDAAEACAPTNAYAHAEADRFTEFTVTIDSGETISTNQMIATARKFIPVAKEYLSALRFSTRGNLIAELDRDDIDFVEDWARVPDARIAMLLPRESRTGAPRDPTAIERYQSEQRIAEALANDPAMRDKTDAANRNFRQALQNAFGELTLGFESLQKSVALGGARSLHDLDNCDKELRNAAEHIERGQIFWTEPAKEWERLLEVQGISGELREALLKGFSTIFQFDAARTTKVFAAFNAQAESCRYVLRLLENETDKWKFSGGGIALTDDEFARKFERAQRQMREDFQATEAALRTWHDATGP